MIATETSKKWSKTEVIINRLSFLKTLDPSLPSIGSSVGGFRMDRFSLNSSKQSLFFLCTYSQRDLPVLLKRGGINLSFRRL